jgi:hypothetical protein
VLKGRALTTATEFTDLSFSFSFAVPTIPFSNLRFGQILSYVDAEHFIEAFLWQDLTGEWHLSVFPPTGIALAVKSGVPGLAMAGTPSGSLKTVVKGNKATFYIAGPGEDWHEVLSVEHALIGAKGKAAIYDENGGAEGGQRHYDDLEIQSLAPADFAGTATLRWEQGYY